MFKSENLKFVDGGEFSFFIYAKFPEKKEPNLGFSNCCAHLELVSSWITFLRTLNKRLDIDLT